MSANHSRRRRIGSRHGTRSSPILDIPRRHTPGAGWSAVTLGGRLLAALGEEARSNGRRGARVGPPAASAFGVEPEDVAQSRERHSVTWSAALRCREACKSPPRPPRRAFYQR
jgi:hypothetical protein